MGGNTKAINRATGEVYALADKIDLSKIDRSEFIKDITHCLYAIETLYFEQYTVSIIPEVNNDIFSGSTKFLFDNKISDEEFVKYKPTVGDLDIMVPMDQLSRLFDFLACHEFFDFTTKIKYIGQNRKACNNLQINALFRYNKDLYFQIDFEGVSFKNGQPDDFAKFAHSANWNDIKAGYKGVLHKLLLRNLVKAISIDNNMIVLTPASSEIPGDPKWREKKITSTPRHLTFSVDRGLRKKYRQVSEVNGKKVYKELQTAESFYETDIRKIFVTIFNVIPSQNEITQFNSFRGLVELIQKYIPNKTISIMYDYLIEDSLFGESVQHISRDNWKEDYDVKVKIIQKLWATFPELKKRKDETILKMKEFYKNYGK